MTNKLIQKGEAVNELYERSRSFTVSMFATSSECQIARIVALECASIVANMPTIDCEPVVRCKNCKHWGTGYMGETEYGKECALAHYMIGENGYCLYGEVEKNAAD